VLVPRISAARPDLGVRPTWHQVVDYISASEERNHLVATDAARCMRLGRTPLVLTRRVEHARTLAGTIATLVDALDASVILLVGSDDDQTRRQRLEELNAVPTDRPLCVVATGSYVGEGFDLDRLDTLLLAGPVAFEGTLSQWVGRLHRVREGKSEVVVMDYVDPAIPMLDREWRRRAKAYGKLGYRMAVDGDLGLVGLEGRSEPVGHLFAGKESSEALLADLIDSSSRVTMSSSWARFARMRAMREALSGAIGRGVAVEVVLREPRKPSTEWHQVLAALRDLGCAVRIAGGGEPLDVVVIDGSLVWCGDAAPLAYPRRDDCTLRFASREVAAELVEALTKSDV
jgi:hypothetical protein